MGGDAGSIGQCAVPTSVPMAAGKRTSSLGAGGRLGRQLDELRGNHFGQSEIDRGGHRRFARGALQYR